MYVYTPLNYSKPKQELCGCFNLFAFIQCSELLNTCHVHVSNMHDIIRKLSKRDHPDARGMNIYTPVHIHIYIVYLFIEGGRGGELSK